MYSLILFFTFLVIKLFLNKYVLNHQNCRRNINTIAKKFHQKILIRNWNLWFWYSFSSKKMIKPPGYPVPVPGPYRSTVVAPYRNRPPPPPIYVQPNRRGATDETFLTPAQRVNRRKIHGGCYTFHDYVMNDWIHLKNSNNNLFHTLYFQGNWS
jgi:hypothetical protein